MKSTRPSQSIVRHVYPVMTNCPHYWLNSDIGKIVLININAVVFFPQRDHLNSCASFITVEN